MAIYKAPGVEVTITEEETGVVAGSATLEACIVGPGYQVVESGMAGLYDSTEETYDFPGLLDGATVDEDTIVVTMVNAADGVTYTLVKDTDYTVITGGITVYANIYATLVSGTDGYTDGVNPEFESADGDFINNAIANGDYLHADDGTVIYICGVLSVDDESTLLIDQVLPSNTYTYGIRRYLVGSLFISYRAIRTDIVEDLLYFTDVSDVIDQAGGEQAIIPENRLFYGAYLCCMQGTGCYATGVNDMAGDKDYKDYNLTAWNTAFDFLKDYRYLYSYVILNQAPAVIAAAQTFVDWMSMPEHKAESVAFACWPRVTDEEAVPWQEDSAAHGVLIESGGPGTGYDTFTSGMAIDFVAYGCQAGGYVEILGADGVTYSYRVSAVFNAYVTLYNDVSAADLAAIDPLGPPYVNLSWRYVNNYYTAAEEARYYKAVGESFEDKRVRICLPSTVGISVGGVVTSYPGYYLYCIRAGKIAANENPSTPYTRDVVGVIERSYMFTTDQDLWDIVASGGIELFIQDRTNTPVYSRHQLTTDMTLNARKEQSVVHAVDHGAKLYRSRMEPMIGKYVINDAFISSLNTICNGINVYLTRKLRSLDSAKTLSIEQDETDSTAINIAVRFGPLYPANNIYVDIYVI